MDVLKIVLIVIAAYLVGSFNAAIIYTSKILGNDVREAGSKNAGATNVARCFGPKAGIITLLADFLKTGVAVYAGYLLYGATGSYIAAMACQLGHCLPVYHGFRGGKGVAVCGASALFLFPKCFGIMIFVFLMVFAASKKVSLCSMTAALFFPLSMFLFGETSVLPLCCGVFQAAMLIIMHRQNIARLLEGTESSFKLGSSNKKK